MNFNLNDEQRMLADTIDRWVVSDRLPQRARGANTSAWPWLAEMGIFGLTIPQAQGGLGLGAAELVVVMRSLGGAVLPEPVVPTLCAVSLLCNAGTQEQRERWLAELAGGRVRAALALEEEDSHHDPLHVRTRLADGRLSGHKSVVIGGSRAGLLVVSAIGPNGLLQLVLVDSKSPGVQVTACPTIDGQEAAEIRFDAVAVAQGDLLPGSSADLLDAALDFGRTALCAEAAGTMASLFNSVLEHLRTRQQFGQPLARFQALQHRAVEMLISVEQSWSLALMAAAGLEQADAAARRRAVSTAKAQIGRHARRLGEEAIQLFGGIGMTEELAATAYVKRLIAIDMTWGDRAFHTDRYLAESKLASTSTELTA